MNINLITKKEYTTTLNDFYKKLHEELFKEMNNRFQIWEQRLNDIEVILSEIRLKLI